MYYGGSHKIYVAVEDSSNSTPWENTFEFNSKDNGDDSQTGNLVDSPTNPIDR